ncbi:MAG TPA: riboflavin synthase [Mycobacteriales bacterium]|nr:riboflavin synthase [Mycobacteriales bacterium]
MFTGIVESLGAVVMLERLPDAARLTIGASLDGLHAGDSVAVNGVCLTVVGEPGEQFTADVMNETLRRSTLGELSPGDAVNLEQAVTPTTRLGGHIVQGHVDGVGRVVARCPSEHWDDVDIEIPAGLSRYVVEKGSIAFDGVSLTVAGIADDTVRVSLIPETLRRTTFGKREVGSAVNVEVDLFAKHIERLLAANRAADQGTQTP